MMNFDQLCDDFAKRRPTGPITGTLPFFKAEWNDGRQSVNDLLRSYLRENGYDYLNTLDGAVWFLYRGQWRCCQHDVNGNVVQFYICDFAVY